eukprot:COSAG04_NODE_1934_length_5182_cov_25.084349_7_plen_98_part_00
MFGSAPVPAVLLCLAGRAAAADPPHAIDLCALLCALCTLSRPQMGGLSLTHRRGRRTVYALRPYNLTGLANKDSGDAAGDIFFCPRHSPPLPDTQLS